MTDESAGVVGVSVLLAIFLFIGWWFGWQTVFWIVIISAAAIGALAFLSRKK